jgi:hypothetical protein
MDIMNNMTVSTSKLTFSLIAISALLISGSGFVLQDASAFNAPEFTAKHLNTTATQITFNMSVNGTLALLDWGITILPTATAGDVTYDVIPTGISNATSAGIGQTAASAGDIAVSSVHASVVGVGFLNGTDLVLIHPAIPTDATYYINYTNNALTPNPAIAGGTGAFHVSQAAASDCPAARCSEGSTTNKILKVGSNATAIDWILPTVTSAEILKSNPQQVRILMSENIQNINATEATFAITGTTGSGNAAVPYNTVIRNSTDGYLLVDLQNPANIGDVLTIAYTPGSTWIVDSTNSTRYGIQQGDATYVTGHGNRAAAFSSSITNWLELGMFGDVTKCYDCEAPTVTKVQISLDSSTPITINDDNKVHVNAGIDDTVSVMVTVTDNIGADTISFAGLYTNFGETPDNLYYSNNFDSAKQMSTSYYEWNVRTDDTAFDNNGAITWTDATAKVNLDRTQTFTYTMTINDAIESSQVWVDIGDKSGNYAKLALPITLEVSGAPGLTFASDDTQKVVSFFNESILLAIVSQWTTTSSDDASNVEQLSSVLGIESQLPTWTTELASWVADDKIDVADMIVAVEYVINL